VHLSSKIVHLLNPCAPAEDVISAKHLAENTTSRSAEIASDFSVARPASMVVVNKTVQYETTTWTQHAFAAIISTPSTFAVTGVRVSGTLHAGAMSTLWSRAHGHIRDTKALIPSSLIKRSRHSKSQRVREVRH
jgi:hypothetical protein